MASHLPASKLPEDAPDKAARPLDENHLICLGNPIEDGVLKAPDDRRFDAGETIIKIVSGRFPQLTDCLRQAFG